MVKLLLLITAVEVSIERAMHIKSFMDIRNYYRGVQGKISWSCSCSPKFEAGAA